LTLKQFIYRTPFAKMAKEVEATLQYASYINQPLHLEGHKTVYCISPYKTGTTFLASSFDCKAVRHEPDQYLALKRLDENFDEFFVKRMNKLNLKLECSGFWSVYIDQLANHKIASELDYLCIFREPSSWITSLINYYNTPYFKAMKFEYQNECFFKRKVGLDVREIFTSDSQVDQGQINKLIDFYFDFTEKTQKLKNVQYIRLKDLKDNIYAIGDLIGEKPNLSKRWMRKAKEKNFVYRDEELDRKYNQLISTFKPFGS
jgi:hypothetical protein